MSPNAAILGDPRVRQSISCKGKGALLLVSQDESRRSSNYVTITSHTYFEQYCVSGLIFNRNKEQLCSVTKPMIEIGSEKKNHLFEFSTFLKV